MGKKKTKPKIYMSALDHAAERRQSASPFVRAMQRTVDQTPLGRARLKYGKTAGGQR